MSNILAIDPGPEKSSWVVWDGDRVLNRSHSTNEELLSCFANKHTGLTMAIEMIAPIGMRVGAEVFETAYWVGRFVQAWAPRPFLRVKRGEVKMHLCGTMRCKDKDIREKILKIFGGKEKAVGNIRNPGPLYGVATHMWSALAVALTAQARHQMEAMP